MANVAWLLANEHEMNVLVIDWDLEAPGLHRFFGLKSEDIKTGLVDLLYDYKDLLRGDASSLPEKIIDISKYITTVKNDETNVPIMILAAGRQDAEYAKRVNGFSWEEFYAKWHGFQFIEYLKKELQDSADIVLIDSRTGITDIGGICTMQLPDVVVLLFALNYQNLFGIKSVIDSIQQKAISDTGRDAPPKLIIRPARVERYLEQDRKDEMEREAAMCFSDYLPAQDKENPIKYMKKKSVPYIGGYSFGETPLAVRKDRSGDLAEALDDLTITILKESNLLDEKKEVLKEYDLLTDLLPQSVEGSPIAPSSFSNIISVKPSIESVGLDVGRSIRWRFFLFQIIIVAFTLLLKYFTSWKMFLLIFGGILTIANFLLFASSYYAWRTQREVVSHYKEYLGDKLYSQTVVMRSRNKNL
jgi:cellulose biosynthesis protein BcsQ